MRDPLPAMAGYGMPLGSVLPRGTAGSVCQANWLAGPWTTPSFLEAVTSGKVGTHGIRETAPR